MKLHQSPLSQHQIGQTKQRQQLGGVFGQATIACLPVLEQILHDMKRVLDLGADARLGMLNGFLYLASWGLRQGTIRSCAQAAAETSAAWSRQALLPDSDQSR